MQVETFTLDEIIIKADIDFKPFMGDTTKFKLIDYIDGNEVKIHEVFSKIEGFEVDENKNLKYKGKTVSNLKLGGENFFNGRTSFGLKMIPAKYIEGIELVDTHSDTKLSEGKEKVEVNLTLKKPDTKFYFGEIDGNIGSKNHYKIDSKIFRYEAKKHQTGLLFGYSNLGDVLLDVFQLQNANRYNDSYNQRVQDFSTNGNFYTKKEGYLLFDHKTNISKHWKWNIVLASNTLRTSNESLSVNQFSDDIRYESHFLTNRQKNNYLGKSTIKYKDKKLNVKTELDFIYNKRNNKSSASYVNPTINYDTDFSAPVNSYLGQGLVDIKYRFNRKHKSSLYASFEIIDDENNFTEFSEQAMYITDTLAINTLQGKFLNQNKLLNVKYNHLYKRNNRTHFEVKMDLKQQDLRSKTGNTFENIQKSNLLDLQNTDFSQRFAWKSIIQKIKIHLGLTHKIFNTKHDGVNDLRNYFNPDLEINYPISKRFKLNVKYSYNSIQQNLLDRYQFAYFTSSNKLLQSNQSLDDKSLHNVVLGLDYKKSKINISTQISYNNNKNNGIGNTLASQYYFSNILMNGESNRFSSRLSFVWSHNKWSISNILNGRLSQFESYNNNELQNSEHRNFVNNIGIRYFDAKKLTIFTNVRYNISKQSNGRFSQINDDWKFSTMIRWSFYPKWSFKGNYSRVIQKGYFNNDINMINAKLSYKLKNSELYIAANNITNISERTSTSVSNNIIYYSSEKIFPRQIYLGFKWIW